MLVTLHNKVKVYNLTAGKSLPEWLSERRRNKKAAGGERRVELIHDLEFTHSVRCIFRCPNGTNLFAAGDYPYRLKCFDINELSMKYSFNADMNILSGVCLSNDYRKFALRGDGRQLTVHHTAAIVDHLRVPHLQRGLGFDPFHAELLSCGTSREVFRISLETGAFVESYKTTCEGINHVEVFKRGPVSGLVLAGGVDGVLEAWDSRAGAAAARIVTAGPSSRSGITETCEIRHVSTDDAGNGGHGMLMACGLENGNVLIYDVRLQKPLLVKDHMNSLPIVKTYFFQGKSTSTGKASHILSADTRSLKVWNKMDGSNFTSIEAPAEIYDFCLLRSQSNMVEPYECDDSGVVAICCDVPRVQVMFVPQLGVAPRWASFLDSMTEDLDEEEAATVYDDFTFVSKSDMDALGITAQDMADGKVRPVMHGAFIENGLYRELKAVIDPTGFNRYVAENAAQRKQDRMSSRISRFKRTEPAELDGRGEANGNAEGGAPKNALAAAKADPRFAKAFDPITGKANSPSFALDRSNPAYAKLLQTIEERRATANERRRRYDSELFKIVPEDNEVKGADDDGDDDDDDDIDARKHLRGVKSSGKVTRKRQHREKEKNGANNNDAVGSAGAAVPSLLNEKKQVAMYEVSKGQADIFIRNDKQIHAARKKLRVESLTLEERLKREKK